MKNKQTLTAIRLREVLSYDPETGVFIWRIYINGRAQAGDVAGGVSVGYARIAIDGVRYKAHRLAWFYVHGIWPVSEIDHINGNKADNRIENMREAVHDKNLQNQRKAHCNNKAGVLGVSLTKRGRYVAMIQSNGVQKYLGSYATSEEASAAYLKEKQEIHPFGTLECSDMDGTRFLKNTSKTGFVGVERKNSGRFSAYFSVGYSRFNIGTFDTAVEASEAREKAKTDHLNRKTGMKSP